MGESEELCARRRFFRRPHWLLLRWVGLRWQCRLGWLGVLLLGAGPLVATAFLFWYVRCSRLQADIERHLSGALGASVRASGLQVKGLRQYAVARLTLSSPEEGAAPILKGEAGVLRTGDRPALTFSRATVNLTDGDALAHWSRLLRPSVATGSLQVAADAVRLEGAPEELPQADSTVHGGIVCTSGRRLASLHARFAGDGRADLTVQGTSSGVTLSLTPTPTLLGRERLAALLGWPAALVPPDLVGEVVVTADSRGVTTALVAEGSIDMAELTRRLNLPPCSGSVALRLDLECSSGSASGTVAVNLADGSAQVDPLVLETFRYVFLGLLSEAAVEQGDRWTIDRIAFVVAFDGDRVSIEAGTEGRPLIAGRSEQGAALELTMPALTTLEDVARRGRLALGP